MATISPQSPALSLQGISDTRAALLGATFTTLVHVTLGILFLLNADGRRVSYPPLPGLNFLCDDLRCRGQEVSIGRRPIDPGSGPMLDTIEVSVISALGLKQPAPKELPKLVKYEQPKAVQDGINIEKKNPQPKKLKKKENLPKKAELDKRRKRPTLDELLDAPRDKDPRKRATMLDNIIGERDGSVYGSDPTGVKGHPALTRIQQALTKEFVPPAMIPDTELRRLQSRVTLNLSSKGTIAAFSARRSGNPNFDTAVKKAIQMFMPKEGGSRRLSDVPDDIRAAINAKKVNFVFDGAKLRR